MSWRCEVLTDQWMTCGLRFATKEEAEAYISAMHLDACVRDVRCRD